MDFGLPFVSKSDIDTKTDIDNWDKKLKDESDNNKHFYDFTFSEENAKGLASIVSWGLDLVLRWVDPQYVDDMMTENSNGDEYPDLGKIANWLMESDWTGYFSEETLGLFGSAVWDIGNGDYEKL